MDVAKLEKHFGKIIKLLKIENDEIQCQFLVMTEAEWWKLGENKTMDGFLGFGLAQSYSCLVKVCEAFLSKLNLGQFSMKRRLGTIMK